jgi:hypothetical protein
MLLASPLGPPENAMRLSALPFVIAAAAACMAAAPAARAAPPGCALPTGMDPLAERQELLAEFERLPQQCLEGIFRECTAASSQGFLDLGAAAVCSFGYEALLRQGFGGNFHALMAWWRSEKQASLRH